MDIQLLKKLREETDASFADCKKALIDSDNSYEKALEIVTNLKFKREQKEKLALKAMKSRSVLYVENI